LILAGVASGKHATQPREAKSQMKISPASQGTD